MKTNKQTSISKQTQRVPLRLRGYVFLAAMLLTGGIMAWIIGTYGFYSDEMIAFAISIGGVAIIWQELLRTDPAPNGKKASIYLCCDSSDCISC